MTRAGVSIDIAESQEGDPSGKCTGSGGLNVSRATCRRDLLMLIGLI